MKIFKICLRILAAIIMLQTLYFKFTAHPMSVAIFEKLQLEPYGRVGIGIAELIASILLLVPRTVWIGSLLGFGLMLGALLAHFQTLGIYVDGDSSLFLYALTTFFCCGILILLEKKVILEKLQSIIQLFSKK